MTAVMHVALIVLVWFLRAYAAVACATFTCLLLTAFAALLDLHLPHRPKDSDDCLVRVLEREGYLR